METNLVGTGNYGNLSGYWEFAPVEPPPPPDRDGDGISDAEDNCLSVANPEQIDENKDGIIISVEDDGPGIKKEDYDQAIKPFIRLDTSRNQNIPGSGLGLSISQDITSNHGGKMSMSQSSLGGLKVSLNFPK